MRIPGRIAEDDEESEAGDDGEVDIAELTGWAPPSALRASPHLRVSGNSKKFGYSCGLSPPSQPSLPITRSLAPTHAQNALTTARPTPTAIHVPHTFGGVSLLRILNGPPVEWSTPPGRARVRCYLI